ncbi:MAG TPA: fibronectin type III domain-containing protein, partial [Blastocatellia bacterium]|nr:fibronectin type III domain-containing protein [Blastocatellia bacterium]
MKKAGFFLATAFCTLLLSATAWGQTTIAQQDFESTPATPTWTFTGSANTVAGSSGSGDRPASSTFYTSSNTAMSALNGTTTVTFSNINLSGYTSVVITFRVAAFSIGSTNGMDGTDTVIAAVSTDGGTNYSTQVTISGNNNAFWHYTTGTGNASTTLGTPISVAPSNGGARTTDGYSTVTINVPDGTSQVSLKITATNNSTSERWCIDDVKITGTTGSCTTPTTQASALIFSSVASTSMTVGWTNGDGSKRIVKINTSNSFTNPVDGTDPSANAAYGGSGEQVVFNGSGSSVSVTGLSANTTYFFRVYEANCSGSTIKFLTATATNNPNSQATAVDPATIQFRSAASGNWNSTATWESSTDGTTWSTATQTPTSTNSTITIRASHTVTITANVTVDQVTVNTSGQISLNSSVTLTVADGSGADLTVNGTLVNAGTISQTGSIVFGSGSKYQHNQDGGAGPTATWDTNSTFEVTGWINSTSTNLFSSSASYGNVTWNSSGQTATYQASGTLVTVNGNLRIVNTGSAANGFRLSSTNGYTINIGGDLIIEGGILNISNGTGNTCTVNLSGSYNQSGGTFNPNATLSFNFAGTSKTFTQSGGTLTNTNINWTVNSGASITLNNNLAVATGKSVTVNGTLDCLTNVISGAGSVAINNGGTLKVGSTSASGAINGNITATGGVTLNSGSTVEFKGTAAQFVAARTFSNLTVNNSNGVTLNADITVDGTLALTSGDITTGAFTLFMGVNAPNSTGTGDVVGSVNRSDLNGGTTRSFGNPFVQITETAGTVNDITVNLIKGSTPSDFLNSIKRVYTITVNNGTNLAATVQLHYLDNELNGNTDESMLQLWRKDATLGWQAKGKDVSGGNDASNNWVKLSGVTQFSPWTISGPNAPTAVEMMGFNAVSDESGNVLIEWQTGTEVNNLGFNIYREQAGQREKVNPTLVAGSVPLAGRTVMTAGINYSWVDKLASAKEEAIYWLEDVDLDGTTTLHGPFSVLPVGKLPARADSLLLSQVNASAANADAVRILRPGSAATDSAAPVRLSSGDLQKQWEIAAKAGAKILIGKPGWYRITQPQLLAAGFDTSKDPRFLQLFTDAQEVPLIVSGGLGGRLEPTDFIEFYAQGLDTPSTNRRAYYLTNGALPGRRVSVVSVGKGRETRNRSFTSTVERRDRFLYFPSINNGEAENWFGAIVSPTPFNQPISVAKLNQAASDDALLEVALQGLGSSTGPEHAVRLQLNGQEIGAMSFTGQQHQVAQFRINQRLLQEGNNQLTFTSQGGSDFSVIDSVKLSYAHRFVADQNSLLLSAAGGEMVQVTGF